MQEVTLKENELIVVTGISRAEAQRLALSTDKMVVMLPDGATLDTIDIQTAKSILDGIIQGQHDMQKV